MQKITKNSTTVASNLGGCKLNNIGLVRHGILIMFKAIISIFPSIISNILNLLVRAWNAYSCNQYYVYDVSCETHASVDMYIS